MWEHRSFDTSLNTNRKVILMTFQSKSHVIQCEIPILTLLEQPNKTSHRSVCQQSSSKRDKLACLAKQRKNCDWPSKLKIFTETFKRSRFKKAQSALSNFKVFLLEFGTYLTFKTALFLPFSAFYKNLKPRSKFLSDWNQLLITIYCHAKNPGSLTQWPIWPYVYTSVD